VQPRAFYDEQGIDLRISHRVTAIDPESRDVVLADGRRQPYERLLLATGSSPRRLDVPGADLPGVHYLRTVADADALRAAAAGARRVVVVGGGWIGTEVTASLRQLGLPVTMVTAGPLPLEAVLGREVATVYRDLHVEQGVRLVRGRVAAIAGDRAAEAVELTDGMRLEGDLVVVGIGAGPRIELALAAGLEVDDGIRVDEQLQSSHPGIFAAGDVAAAWHPRLATRLRVEHRDNAKRQGRAAARNMLGIAEAYTRLPFFYSDQYDLGMEYRGYAPEWDQVVLRGDVERRTFLAFWLANGRVLAAMNANIWDMGDELTHLVDAQLGVDARRLADPGVPITEAASLPV
jgi:3-phenylpropionate/trans-cinnamate dioxygenase ferredoxin reductase subunit